MNHQYIKNVATLALDQNKCTGCTMCVKVCPHNVFEMRNKKAEIINFNKCMECGACALNCVPGALTVKQGVGCAAAVISGFMKGTEPNCDCGGGDACC